MKSTLMYLCTCSICATVADKPLWAGLTLLAAAAVAFVLLIREEAR